MCCAESYVAHHRTRLGIDVQKSKAEGENSESRRQNKDKDVRREAQDIRRLRHCMNTWEEVIILSSAAKYCRDPSAKLDFGCRNASCDSGSGSADYTCSPVPSESGQASRTAGARTYTRTIFLRPSHALSFLPLSSHFPPPSRLSPVPDLLLDADSSDKNYVN